MRVQTFPALVVACLGMLFLVSCAGERKTATIDDLYTRDVRLPDGSLFRAEVATKAFDRTRGMMFRDALPDDRALMIVHPKPGKYPVFTYQVKIPLDFVWLDQNRLIREIVTDVPPCKSDSATKCPQYGGTFESLVVLEFNAGIARKHKLNLGDRLDY